MKVTPKQARRVFILSRILMIAFIVGLAVVAAKTPTHIVGVVLTVAVLYLWRATDRLDRRVAELMIGVNELARIENARRDSIQRKREARS